MQHEGAPAGTREARPERKAPRPPSLWILALITLSGTLGMHIFVPALPAAASDLGATQPIVQLTLSVYILGLAVGQLVYGPVSDRYGRRPTMLAGLVLFTGAGLAAGLAPDAPSLIAARLVQALGGCAGLVLGRAMVRDMAGPRDAARSLAFLNVMTMAGPGLAPLAGAWITGALGWRALFAVLVLVGLVLMVVTWRSLPETRAENANPDLRSLARNYRELLQSRSFLALAVGGGCATTSTYAFIGSAPFIFTETLGSTVQQAGFAIALMTAGVAAGSLSASRLIVSLPLAGVMVAANLVSVIAAFVFLALVMSADLTAGGLIGTMVVYFMGAGAASPLALSQAVSVNPRVIGSASGLYGFMQMVIGAICTTLAGLGGAPALSTALVLCAAGVVAQACFWVAVRRGAGGLSTAAASDRGGARTRLRACRSTRRRTPPAGHGP